MTGKRVYSLLKSSEISSVMLGHRRLIVLASVDQYVARLIANPSATIRPTPNPRRRSAA
jgi:hypothetical protein